MDVIMPRPRALKHVQVREHVRSLIEQQPPGSAAPSERELVARFGVARMTVRQALDALVAEGLLERIPGRGTFVAQPRQAAGRLTSFTEEIRRRGMLPESQTLLARVEQAGPGVARALDISPGDPVLHWRRLRRADQEIVCVEDAYLNEVLLPGFLQHGTPTSLYDALESRGLRPTNVEDSISADSATLGGGRRPRDHRGRSGAAALTSSRLRRSHRRGLAHDLPPRPLHGLPPAQRPLSLIRR